MIPAETGWRPFRVLAPELRPDSPRSLRSPLGVGDRLRAAAFAEIQAREAFLWAAGRYEDAPPAARDAWRALGAAEDRHLGWLLGRLAELRLDPRERGVSRRLWDSLVSCPTARDFAWFMAAAEERGRQAGLRFQAALLQADPATSEIFGRIAAEEEGHIALARKFF